MSTLKVGDVVRVASLRTTGTVTAIDSVPGRPGVQVKLHNPVNFTAECYATHQECERVERQGGDAR